MIDINFKIKENVSENNYAEFVIEPLEPGYGYTLGHAIRRVLLTSIPGAAVTSVKITGVKHRFSEVPGLKENIVDFLLNVKTLYVRLPESQESATLKLSVKGSKEITGADFTSTDGAEVMNPEYYLGALSGDKAKLEMELTVEKGYGYSLSEERSVETLGVITTDAVFSPIKRVNYSVEATRVGRRTNLDKLILQVWTNGSVTPREALDQTSRILANMFMQIYEPQVSHSADSLPAATSAIPNDVLRLTVDELDLPTRIYNSLKNGGIETVEQLLGTPRKELVNMRNMGAKSISIIEEKLQEKNVTLPA
ncbi:MAG TPA: DNA-directed RNA polymerase subunit alpha [Candidatus Saccharimonadales bacterium]|nr:DNA-directed RNA polymerase subunit alpha [Candidatus Saccharimonadales bacterium]